ncbi:unnamed protein product [Amoebophrya sp. A120]|nr:unnamed protein product [Amoebophrya sp. A120]|eukprot:GSA120T00012562001.1
MGCGASTAQGATASGPGAVPAAAASAPAPKAAAAPAAAAKMTASGRDPAVFLASVFKQLDTNNSNEIDKKELRRALAALGLNKEKAQEFMDKLDPEGGASVSEAKWKGNMFPELQHAIEAKLNNKNRIEGFRPLVNAEKVFAQIDQDHSGDLDMEEMKKIFGDMGMTADETEQIFSKMNVDESGKITKEQFKAGLDKKLLQHFSKHLSDEGLVKDPNYPPYGLALNVQTLPDWIKLGCGDKEYYCEEKGATFPGDKCPDQLPDLSNHGNLCALALRDHPEIYEKYKNVTTPGGVSLAKCIKTGIDNPGHPHILTCGLVAGDEDCFTTFKDLFDIVIGKRNGDYPADAVHTTNMNIDELSTTKIDPTGNYCLTTRCRTGRSVRGLPLPPACTFEERRETERVCVKGLMKMEGELKGQYFPLNGSKSMDDQGIFGMSAEKEEHLRNAGNLFQEPDSTLLLSSGCGRHWPDARGIFHNDAENFFVWVNEEDQLRIVSMEKGDNIHAIFTRFANATKAVQECLKSEGYDFMHSDHLGYILTCPSNLGTGLRAGTMVKLPLFSARPDFKDILKKMKLQARGTAGVDSASTGGTWDISNADRLGMSEVQLCNLFIEGVAQVIKWEQALEAGEDIEAEVAEAKPLGI